MKNLHFAFVLLISTFANAQSVLPKLSAATHQYLWRMKNEKTERAYVYPGYVYRHDAAQQLYISTFLKVTDGFSADALQPLGVKINTRAGNIWTAQVPVENFEALTQLSGIACIDMDAPVAFHLDSARAATRVDSVHSGIALPQPYTGKNVVVGIIDAGFDYTHPAFYDTAYNTYRVKKVWEQKTTGTPPSGFSYGAEYADSASIHAKGYDVNDGSHGTHVAGIAAGSGYGANSTHAQYRGMAYNSDLVFVAISPTLDYWLTSGMADMLDGVQYIYNYAQSVSKPAIANLSWGGPLGPHDGTGLFSQALDNLSGPGKLFTISAGNNGTGKIHLQKTFSPTDISVNTFLTFNTSLPSKTNRVDIWGDSSKAFFIKFILYNNNTRTDSTVQFGLDDLTHGITLRGSDGDTCFITLSSASVEFNGKPHMLLDVFSKTTNRLCINLVATEGTVHMWQGYVLRHSGYYASFSKYNYSWAVEGDLVMQVSDMASTQSAITVGAYNSKVFFKNISGQNINYSGNVVGRIASFSSHGPTADGRTKPDITGPGMALASSVSAADSGFMQGGVDYNLVSSAFVSPKNGQTYAYAMLQGTSMSSPAVGGIVALLLEANPSLTPQQVKDILAATAIVDSSTGTIPAQGSTTWGFGKANAYAAIKKALETSGIFHETASIECMAYPNPGSGAYTLQYLSEANEIAYLSVFNMLGELLQQSKAESHAGIHRQTIDLSNQPAGTYIVKLQQGAKEGTIRIVKQ